MSEVGEKVLDGPSGCPNFREKCQRARNWCLSRRSKVARRIEASARERALGHPEILVGCDIDDLRLDVVLADKIRADPGKQVEQLGLGNAAEIERAIQSHAPFVFRQERTAERLLDRFGRATPPARRQRAWRAEAELCLDLI